MDIKADKQVFSAIRARRVLTAAIKSDVYYAEQADITLQYLHKPTNDTKEEIIKQMNIIATAAEKMLHDVEILTIATKLVPEWFDKGKINKKLDEF